MSKPPKSPPSSDIAGVRRDEVAVDAPENGTPDPGERLDDAEDGSKARPDRNQS